MAQNPIVKSLGEKVSLLLAENERLHREQDKLIVQRDKLNEENLKLKNYIYELEKRINVLEIGESLTGSAADTKQAKVRINRLMREIDRCIALINR